MKAVYIAQHGGPEALTYGDRPEPEVEPEEVMIKVGGSALNHTDLNLREGFTPHFGIGYLRRNRKHKPKRRYHIKGRGPCSIG